MPEAFADAAEAHRRLMLTGLGREFARYRERGADKLSAVLLAAIEDGERITAVDYLEALAWQGAFGRGLERLFDRFDAILTPAAPGEAPHTLESTGSPAFNGLWTLCGVPAITLPLLSGPNNLPVGVQLVGRRDDDARLLRTARWLANAVLRDAGSGKKGDV